MDFRDSGATFGSQKSSLVLHERVENLDEQDEAGREEEERGGQQDQPQPQVAHAPAGKQVAALVLLIRQGICKRNYRILNSPLS